MKNAMKKLMSLLLVAVLLVSAVPFAASAAVKVPVVVNGWDKELIVDGSVVLDNATAQSLVTKSTVAEATWSSPFGDATGKELTEDGVNEYNAANPDAPYSLTMSFTAAETGNGGNSGNQGGGNDGTQGGGNDGNQGGNNSGNQGGNNSGNQGGNNGGTVEPTVDPIKVVVKVDKSDNVVFTGSKAPANGENSVTGDLLTYVWSSDWDNKYTFDHAWTERTGSFNDKGVKINAGEEVHIMLKSVEIKDNSSSNNSSSNNDGVRDEEFMEDIWLYIYTNNDLINPAKRVMIRNYNIVSDHELSKKEILSVVDDYYKASNANNGIIWKGAYVENAKIAAYNFIEGKDETNGGTTTIDGLEYHRSNYTTIVKVRVTGVTAKTATTYTADSSNPKTGDTIYTAFAVMGISAASLAAVMYVYNKKRMAL